MNTLYGSTPEEIEAMIASVELPKYRAAQLLDWVYQKNVLTWDGLRISSTDGTGQTLQAFDIRDPRYRDYDFPPGAKLMPSADFDFAFGFPASTRRLGIADVVVDVDGNRSETPRNAP